MRNLGLLLGSVACVVSGAVSPGCSDGSDACPDAAALQARLDTAAPGDTVSLGACTIAGPLTVPAGVRLQGAGSDQTTVSAGDRSRAVTLLPGEPPATVADLAVESDGCAGIVAVGAGRVAIESVEVRASRGVGVALEGLSGADIRAVDVRGPIDAATADTVSPPRPPFGCGSSPLATHGIVLVDVAGASLSAVTVEGLAAFGVVAVRSTIAWTDGSVSDGLGAGFEILGGSAQLDRVTVSGMRHGAGATESFGGVIAGGADVTTTDLVVDGNAGFGLLHDGSSAVHTGLSALDNGFAAAWAQSMTAFEIVGASTLEDNAFAGVVAIDSTGVVLRGGVVSGTVEGVRVSGVRTVRAADGVSLVSSDATLEGLELVSNDRVGVLVDLGGGSSASVALDGVAVDGTGTELGVIGQNGTLAAGWDDGVTRAGATVGNDAAFTGTLPVGDAVGPPCFPPAGLLGTSGIAPLTDP